MAIGTKLGLDATHKLPGENGFHREWPPIIEMDEAVKKKVDEILNTTHDSAR
jgi:4-hydroxy-3-polyprenylbenzoate decarboxylase